MGTLPPFCHKSLSQLQEEVPVRIFLPRLDGLVRFRVPLKIILTTTVVLGEGCTNKRFVVSAPHPHANTRMYQRQDLNEALYAPSK
jgi:hypothetical protein